jgi:hypothetical protein
MSSLLTFVWRRRRNTHNDDDDGQDEDHLYNHHRNFNPNLSPVPPTLMDSHSSDASTVVTDYKREEFICIPRRRGVVVTPDGLKPRRFVVDLRDELLGDTAELLLPEPTKRKEPIDAGKIDDTSTALVPVLNDPDTSLIPVTEFAVVQNPNMWRVVPDAGSQIQIPWSQQQYGPSTVLPPLPTRSWSTQGDWSSPTPAYSSQNGSWPPSTDRGSWGNTTPSAESPNLVPGRARTAVGNLVANQQDPPGTTPMKETSYDFAYSPQEQGVETMYSPMYSRAGSKNARTTTYPLPHIAERGVIAGMSNVQSATALLRSNEQEEGVETMYPPLRSRREANSNVSVSTMSTLPAPSPLARTSVLRTTTAVINSAIVPQSEHGTEVILSQKHLQSGSWTVDSHSGSSGASKRSIKPVTNTVVFADDNVLVHALDGDLKRTKLRNQQRTKEELILSALERLQDDLQLVADVEGLLGVGSSQGMFDWFVPTPLDKEGILTGFSEEKRYAIIDKLDQLLVELNAEVKSQEFFLNSSMVDISEYEDEAHDELREALSFCKVLVQMAVPESEKEESSLQGTNELGKWQFLPGLRAAIGLLPTTTETPPCRGGDSSFFSLPEDDAGTPMTSNVSLGATTLTSIANHTMSPTTPLKHHSERIKLKRQNGLHLRQAIQLLSTGLQKMSNACLTLGEINAGGPSSNSSGLVRVADQIKQTYFQMIAMSQGDLKSVVDAFEFELDPEDSYVYEDTDEEAEVSPIMHVATLAFGSMVNISHDRDSTFDTGPISPPRIGDLSLTDCSDLVVEDEIFACDDDLRREMGSNDYDEQVDEREGAPADAYSLVVSKTSRHKSHARLEV